MRSVWESAWNTLTVKVAHILTAVIVITWLTSPIGDHQGD